ncbi:MAG: ABC transporter permease [Planctomycetes bacterium]|nr:ABC transporter permease [Planctomycetota bacterium]
MASLLAFLLAPFLSAWRRRAVLRELSVREIQGAFSGSMLGLGWIVLQPLASLAVFSLVFGVIFKQANGMEFVSNLFTGLIFFNAFSESVTRASRLVLSRPNYVTKVVFPLDLLPWPPVALAALHAAVSTVLLLVLHTVFVGVPTWSVLALPLVLALVLMLGLGVSFILASVGVYVRDTNEVVRVVVQLLFFLSPVVWTVDNVKGTAFHGVMSLNPLAIAINTARAMLSGENWPSLVPLVGLAVGALLLTAFGHAFFRRTKDGFADVL